MLAEASVESEAAPLPPQYKTNYREEYQYCGPPTDRCASATWRQTSPRSAATRCSSFSPEFDDISGRTDLIRYFTAYYHWTIKTLLQQVVVI